ncbi:sterol desaturase family protein [Actinocorallia longicatena]|uniref:Sterol desaturase family protein n=1 Tax=Actinocorallia longicatena TaxID=111803 RepID=A0ABP6QI90_9ACTN
MKDFRKNGLTLAEAARVFSGHRNARVLLPAAATAIAARALMGRFTRRDAVVAGAAVAMEPFVEWLVHVHVLHAKYRKGEETLIARSHRMHHQDPRDPGLVFIPEHVVLPAVAGIAVINAVLLRRPRAVMTGVATTWTLLAAYEWTHFLIHSSYVPKTALYRTLRRTHQLHHFRNENYWYGIITPVSDKVLNTYPGKDEVPPSKTVKNLGVTESV